MNELALSPEDEKQAGLKALLVELGSSIIRPDSNRGDSDDGSSVGHMEI